MGTATSTFTQLLSFRLNQFSSRRYALRKSRIRPIPSLKRFPNVAFGADRLIRLTDDGPPASFQGRSSSASSFHASLVHAIDGSVTLLLYVQDDHLDFHAAPEFSSTFLFVHRDRMESWGRGAQDGHLDLNSHSS